MLHFNLEAGSAEEMESTAKKRQKTNADFFFLKGFKRRLLSNFNAMLVPVVCRFAVPIIFGLPVSMMNDQLAHMKT